MLKNRWHKAKRSCQSWGKQEEIKMKVKKHKAVSTWGPLKCLHFLLKGGKKVGKVLNANIINSHPVTRMTVIKSSLSRLHYANTFTFTAEGWNIPHLHRWRVFKNRKKSSLDNSTSMNTSLSLTVFEGFFFFLNTPRQPDSFLNPLRCRRCRDLQSLIPFSFHRVTFKVDHRQWEEVTFPREPQLWFIGKKL